MEKTSRAVRANVMFFVFVFTIRRILFVFAVKLVRKTSKLFYQGTLGCGDVWIKVFVWDSNVRSRGYTIEKTSDLSIEIF